MRGTPIYNPAIVTYINETKFKGTVRQKKVFKASHQSKLFLSRQRSSENQFGQLEKNRYFNDTCQKLIKILL